LARNVQQRSVAVIAVGAVQDVPDGKAVRVDGETQDSGASFSRPARTDQVFVAPGVGRAQPIEGRVGHTCAPGVTGARALASDAWRCRVSCLDRRHPVTVAAGPGLHPGRQKVRR
jgi:hypothetical protein